MKWKYSRGVGSNTFLRLCDEASNKKESWGALESWLFLILHMSALRILHNNMLRIWGTYIADRRHTDSCSFYFPVATPELNPAEFIWTRVSEYTAGTAPHHGQDLQTNVFNAVARTRISQKRLQPCLVGTHLKWFD